MARATAEVSLGAIRHNVRALRATAPESTLCAVVKADGYGHGASQVARAALAAGAEWLAVAQVGEARSLRLDGIEAPILLLAEPHATEYADAVAADVRLTVYRPSTIDALAALAPRGRPVEVHLKVDTGMHRVGAPPDDVVALAKQVSGHRGLHLEGVWTHCPVADEPHDPFTSRQIEHFEVVLSSLAAAGIEVPIRHAANSAATIAHPASRFDLVRCGIALYGVAPAPALADALSLAPALRLVTEVAHVQRVPAGQGISYGLRYRPPVDTVVATLPIGYADGVARSLGTARQEVLIGGERHPMAGVVTMDQLMVDCGPDASVGVGDEVVLLGRQGDERITPEEWATHLGTIGYEVVCGVGPRVDRRYVESS